MSIFKKYRDDELSEEEQALFNEANTAQQQQAGMGSMIGGLVGGGAGLLASMFTGGAALPAISTGYSIGQGAGGAIGSWLGGQKSEESMRKFQKIREKRMKPLLEEEAKRAAVYDLLGDWGQTKGM